MYFGRWLAWSDAGSSNRYPYFSHSLFFKNVVVACRRMDDPDVWCFFRTKGVKGDLFWEMS